jgi:2-amino-4-hydroxy-6-hydroxymethyldihydropteridine diphosphokinase
LAGAIRRPQGQAPESRRPQSPTGDAPRPPTAERALQERRAPRPPARAFLGLGSNLGDRRAYLRGALERLPDVVAVSPLYETDPVGGPPGQGAYLNCVAELWTSRTPRELLAAAQAAEAAAGRVRVERWGPRTLDVDVLLVGDEKVEEADLVVPHPRMWSRGFVLVPLGDLAPELVLGHLTSELARGIRAAGNL